MGLTLASLDPLPATSYCLCAQSNSRLPGLLKCTLCPRSAPEHRTSTSGFVPTEKLLLYQTSIQSCTDKRPSLRAGCGFCGSLWNIQWTTRPQKSTTYQVSFVRSSPIRFLNRTRRHGELTNGSLALQDRARGGGLQPDP